MICKPEEAIVIDPDNYKIILGGDVDIYRYDADILKTDDSLVVGVNLGCNALEVNTTAGITGNLQAGGYKSSDGTAGVSETLPSGKQPIFKNGLYVGHTA